MGKNSKEQSCRLTTRWQQRPSHCNDDKERQTGLCISHHLRRGKVWTVGESLSLLLETRRKWLIQVEGYNREKKRTWKEGRVSEASPRYHNSTSLRSSWSFGFEWFFPVFFLSFQGRNEGRKRKWTRKQLETPPRTVLHHFFTFSLLSIFSSYTHTDTLSPFFPSLSSFAVSCSLSLSSCTVLIPLCFFSCIYKSRKEPGKGGKKGRKREVDIHLQV